MRKRFQDNYRDAYVAEAASTEELIDKVDDLAPNIISKFTGKDFKERGQSLKVLIVDDNSSYRQSLRELFYQQFPDTEVVEAGSPEEAFVQVKKTVPDLLLIDIDLAGQSGLELTRKVREELGSAYIVVITSHDLPEFRRAAEESGADYFFSKTSSDIEDMLAWVEAASIKISIP